jgi:hypothetical protein
MKFAAGQGQNLRKIEKNGKKFGKIRDFSNEMGIFWAFGCKKRSFLRTSAPPATGGGGKWTLGECEKIWG